MFNLKTIWEKARLRSAKDLNINGNAKPGRTDEQIVRHVFFAGITLNWSTAEILSTAEANPKANGGLTRLKSELPGMD